MPSIAPVQRNPQNVLEHLPGEVREEVFDEIGKTHYEILEDVWFDIDTGFSFLVYQSFLYFVWLVVTLFYG